MEILLYFVLVLALVGDVLLAILLVRSSRPQKPQGPTADDVVNAMTPVLQGETDLLAEQLRAMQGESARTTTATLRDFSAVLVRESGFTPEQLARLLQSMRQGQFPAPEAERNETEEKQYEEV